MSSKPSPQGHQPPLPAEMTVQQLRERLAKGEDLFLLDVRQPDEFQASHIKGAVLIPLGDLPARLSELSQSHAIVVNCKSGNRSRRACDYLRSQGFANVSNLIGGNDQWQTSE